MKWKKKTLVALLAVFFVLSWPIDKILKHREPSYQGRALSNWLNQLSESRIPLTAPNAERRKLAENEARNAVRNIGTNAFPILMKMVTVEDSALKVRINQLTRKQSLIKFHLKTANDYHTMALAGFDALRDIATPMVPALARLLNDNNNDVLNCRGGRLWFRRAVRRRGHSGINPAAQRPRQLCCLRGYGRIGPDSQEA